MTKARTHICSCEATKTPYASDVSHHALLIDGQCSSLLDRDDARNWLLTVGVIWHSRYRPIQSRELEELFFRFGEEPAWRCPFAAAKSLGMEYVATEPVDYFEVPMRRSA